jgi:hypothetical protein
MKRADLLVSIADCEDTYGSLCTGGGIPRRDVMRAVRAGLVRSIGRVRVFVDDGVPSKPARYAEGFRLTPHGRRRACL